MIYIRITSCIYLSLIGIKHIRMQNVVFWLAKLQTSGKVRCVNGIQYLEGYEKRGIGERAGEKIEGVSTSGSEEVMYVCVIIDPPENLIMF